MTKIRKTYTNEFKVEAVRLLETSGKRAAQIERDRHRCLAGDRPVGNRQQYI